MILYTFSLNLTADTALTISKISSFLVPSVQTRCFLISLFLIIFFIFLKKIMDFQSICFFFKAYSQQEVAYFFHWTKVCRQCVFITYEIMIWL